MSHWCKDPEIMPDIIAINLVLSAFMNGVIWIIQLVHYPSFNYVAIDQWQLFHQKHTKRIAPIVAPVMMLEVITTVLITSHNPDLINLICLVLLVVIWLSTFLIQVPIHNQLHTKYSSKLISRLINTNWARTILWSVKTIILLIGYTLK